SSQNSFARYLWSHLSFFKAKKINSTEQIDRKSSQKSYIVNYTNHTPTPIVNDGVMHVDVESKSPIVGDIKELKDLKDCDTRSQSDTSSISIGLTQLKNATGMDFESILEYAKLRNTVERSSNLSVSCLVTFLILVFGCGLALLITCFINTNSMIQRYNTASSMLDRASDSRKHLINAAHYLKLAQLTGSKFAPELISH